ITWSCLVTILASTWLAVHPNVPGRNLTQEGSVTRWWIPGRPTIMCFLERTKLMLITILAPEAMVGWAIRQRVVAGKVRACSSKGHELKLVHGFFVSMGGFYYGKEERLVTLKDVTKHLKALAKIRAVDIEDRSKTDALSKTLVIFQLLWFAVQYCARLILKLPITLLEISTLAFAIQSIISYIVWWDKPVNVQYQIRLEEHSSMDTGNSSDHLLLHNAPTTGYNSASSHDSPAIETSAPVDIESSPGHEAYAEQSLLEPVEIRIRKVTDPFTGLYFTAMGFIFADDISSGVDRPVLNAATGAAGMSSCNGGKADDSLVHLVVVVGVGWLFAAIHCAAWSFSFPSHAEKVLWRTSSLAIGNAKFDEFASVFFSVLAIAIYIIARVTLIVLALLQFRSLPLLALHTVNWTTFIPHI
ncbi:hypothetical protein EV421DRAFT_1718183, partial [Armillaria borealis]